jgi:hypothetical protein
MISWLLLVLQAALALLAVVQLQRVVKSAVDPAYRALVLDVWGPATVVAPMLFFAGRVDDIVAGVGWIPLGGPIACGVIGLGVALIVKDREGGGRIDYRTIAAWTGAGIVLLLLGAAHHLTLWLGQCAFAAGAVLLWLNTPKVEAVGATANPREDARGGWLLVGALSCAVGQGIVGLLVTPAVVGISGGVMVAYAAAVVVTVARIAGGGAGLRLGGWAAAYGVLLGLGVLALIHLLPQAVRALTDPHAQTTAHVAYGFGRYAGEATALVALGGAAVALRRLDRAVQTVAGAAVLALAVAAAAWRLAVM